MGLNKDYCTSKVFLHECIEATAGVRRKKMQEFIN